jgi:hypothetical protein
MTVMGLLPPSDPLLQEFVRAKVTKLWPPWFVDKIIHEGGSAAGFNMVLYYLAYINLPSVTTKPEGMKYVRVKPLAKYTPGTQYSNTLRPFGAVGTHEVAYVDLGARKIHVFDTRQEKIIFSGTLPAGEWAKHQKPITMRILGPHAFLLALERAPQGQVPGFNNTTQMIWDWSKPTENHPVLVKTHVFERDWLNIHAQGRGADNKTITSTLKALAFPEGVSKKPQSVTNVVTLFGHTGLAVIRSTEISLFSPKSIILLDLSMLKQHGVVNGEKFSSAGYLTKNGDIISLDSGMFYINFWDMVGNYAKDLIRKFGTKSRTPLPCVQP